MSWRTVPLLERCDARRYTACVTIPPMSTRTDHEAQPFDGAPVRPAATRRERHLRDGHLTEWRVYERICGTHDRTNVRLVFESDGAIRTLKCFPATWRDMSDDDLLELSAAPPC